MNASLQAISLDLSRAEALGGVLQALSTQVSVKIRFTSSKHVDSRDLSVVRYLPHRTIASRPAYPGSDGVPGP